MIGLAVGALRAHERQRFPNGPQQGALRRAEKLRAVHKKAKQW